jgi:UDP-N-acetylglucosamine 2-epimerase (non-hydrolysing)
MDRHHALAELGGSLRSITVGLVIGTRPEAIKMAPVAHALAARKMRPWIFLTGQHPGLAAEEHGLHRFEITPLGCSGQHHPHAYVDWVAETLVRCWHPCEPALVLVQGDTSSALGGARAAASRRIALGHVEAGLRTHDPDLPWPEEEFRTEIDRLSHLLFAPTAGNAVNLRHEAVAGSIFVTGNPGIDALMSRSLRRSFRLFRAHRRPHVLATCHRRENWGEGIDRVCRALVDLASRRMASVDYVLHPNPRVSEQAFAALGQSPGVRLLPPLSSEAALAAMRSADLLLSDSGGMQEEAAALGLPMLVLREKTERMESIESGNAVLVGTDSVRIVEWVERLGREPALRARMSRPALPFGKGDAARRIASVCHDYLAKGVDDARQFA